MNKKYEILKQEELKDIHTKGTLLVHNKSGARIVLLENNDNNKVFSIAFRTPPFDDTGVPHIIEHSVLCGSRKYPVKDPFVELMKGSLNTFLNAITFPDKTMYPVASCNEKDFNNLIDVYMDAVLYPNILNKKEIFMQEGWHYELQEKDAELQYNGVVYNEMKGAFSSVDSIIYRATQQALFPDAPYGTESGGDPKAIPDLTYENFVAFYKRYYHPSNSYIVIYGDCNMDEKLEYLDREYLSKFDKINPNSEIKLQEPFKETREMELEYPLSKDQDINNKTYMSYNIALTDVSQADILALDIINNVLLTASGAILERALLDAKIGNVITGSFESDCLQPAFVITSKNCNVSDKEKFVNIIESEFKKYVKEGLSKRAIEAALNAMEFRMREEDFGSYPKGLAYAMSSLSTWLYDDKKPFDSLNYSEYFNEVRSKINTRYFEELIEKHFINNTHKAIIVVKPSKTLQDKKDKELKDKLAKYKASLNDKQIEQLIHDTKALKEYQNEPDTKEALDTIPALKKEDLDLNVMHVSNIEKDVEGYKVIYHTYQTNGIAYISALFDAKKLTNDLIPYLSLMTDLQGKLDTKKHNYLSLDQDININTGGIGPSLLIQGLYDGDATFLYTMNASTFYNKIEYSFNMFDEIINETNYDMKKRVLEILQQLSQGMMQRFSRSGHSTAISRAFSYTEKNSYLNELTSGIEYFNKVNEIINNYDVEYPIMLEKFKAIENQVFSKENLYFTITCEEEAHAIIEKNVKEFAAKFNRKPKELSIEFKPKILDEAFTTTFDINYCALCGNYRESNLKHNGSSLVANSILSTDYLWKQVRVLGGAYGCMHSIGRDGKIYFVSYRDPKIKETYKVYKESIGYLKNFNVSEEELLKYIIGTIGGYDAPLSAAAKGAQAFRLYLVGRTESDLVKDKKEIINTTLDDIRNVAKYIEAIMQNPSICCLGNEKMINENKDLFKEIKPLFK